MIPDTCVDEENPENDVRYGIADCRKRLRSQRATLRAQHDLPINDPKGENTTPAARNVESYAEILATVSMSQSSLSRLVECLLGPADTVKHLSEESVEQEEAVRT